MKRAVELAIEEANASEAAKAKGITFEIKAEDDAGDPKQAVNVANALASDTGVVALVGHFNSGCSIPASPVYNEANMAMVTVSSNPQLTAQGYKVVNRVVAKDDAQGGFAGELANTMGLKKVAIIDDATPYGQGLASEFKKAFTAGGGTVVAEERIQPKEVDFSALVTKLKKLSPDAVYYAGAHTEGALLTKQMKEGGLKVPVMGGDMLYTPEYIKIAGAKQRRGRHRDRARTAARAAAQGCRVPREVPGEVGQGARGLRQLRVRRCQHHHRRRAGAGADRAAVADAIRAGSIDGVTGTVAFDQNGDNKQQVISAYKVENGEWVQIKQ